MHLLPYRYASLRNFLCLSLPPLTFLLPSRPAIPILAETVVRLAFGTYSVPHFLTSPQWTRTLRSAPLSVRFTRSPFATPGGGTIAANGPPSSLILVRKHPPLYYSLQSPLLTRPGLQAPVSLPSTTASSPLYSTPTPQPPLITPPPQKRTLSLLTIRKCFSSYAKGENSVALFHPHTQESTIARTNSASHTHTLLPRNANDLGNLHLILLIP